MKFYSIELIIHQAAKAFRRFPMALICTILSATLLIYLVDENVDFKDSIHLFYALQTLWLGMVAYLGLSVFSQRYTMRTTTVVMLNMAVAALMVYYFYAQPEFYTVKSVSRFIILLIAAHLGVSFAPFLVNTEVNGFWQYNKSLFIRFLTSAIYSAVFYIGLSIALLAIKELFNIDFGEKIYLYLFITVAVILNTWIFLAGVPSRVIALEQVSDYPKGLRIFTQYVLLPLVVIYLIILYFYEAKILFTLVWPRGIVSYLILGFSTLGMLALLLVWPLRDDAAHTWIRTFTKRFFLAVFPLIILLIMAIGRRVMEYGVTENRYFLIVLSLWLFIVALYFLLSGRKNIKFIPLSLFFAVMLSGFGPWNAFQVSSLSQHNRLEKHFQKNKILVNGKAIKPKKQIKRVDQKEISSIVNYMVDVHGVESIQDLFSQDLSVVTKEKKGDYTNKTDQVLALLGMESNVAYASIEPASKENHEYSCTRSNGKLVSGYDYSIPVNIYPVNDSYDDNGFIDAISYDIKYSEKQFAIIITINKENVDTILLEKTFMNLKSQYGSNDSSVDKSDMQMSSSSAKYDYTLELDGLNVDFDEDFNEKKLSSLRGTLFVKKKSAQ
ncbi:MAG: hypothetical protein RL516_1012 [Bacteroidota bacterium]|jgi:hypothetical protein